jgi:hypothetical protein
MVRTFLVLMAVTAAPAWAVGERIIIPSAAQPFGDQLKDTLCISMDCVKDKSQGLDATVAGKILKGAKKGDQVELTVISSTGAVKATVKAPLADNGRISSMDLVTATSAIIAAIEGPEPKAKAAAADKPEPTKTAKAAKKGGKQLRLAAKARTGHTRG